MLGGSGVQRTTQRFWIAFVGVLGVLLIGTIWLGASEPTDDRAGSPSPTPSQSGSTARANNGKEVENPVVTIEMENGAKIEIELYPDIAPNTVNNFVSLVRKGFYDGTIFHRVIPGFMVQGGDPTGTGTGGPGYSIRGEFASNGFANSLKHTRGVISMARTGMPNSAGSQFFIMVADSPHLDGQYAAFGKVVSGMEEVDRIVSVQRNPQDKPLQDQRMAKVTVDEKDGQYPEPEKM